MRSTLLQQTTAVRTSTVAAMAARPPENHHADHLWTGWHCTNESDQLYGLTHTELGHGLGGLPLFLFSCCNARLECLASRARFTAGESFLPYCKLAQDERSGSGVAKDLSLSRCLYLCFPARLSLCVFLSAMHADTTRTSCRCMTVIHDDCGYCA